MLYISAQPDQTYFIWQLEIQLRNLSFLGISKKSVHVIVAYKKENGVNPIFQEFIERNRHLAQFYTYPDLREKPKYTSSIRPNILKQHFTVFPELVNETIFYHDSDILFSRIPQIEDINSIDICYVSDTRNYLDLSYIRSLSSEQLLDEMLDIVGLSKDKLLLEDMHAGGAQYILKGINAKFWQKVEQDSESLHILIKSYNLKLWQNEYAKTKEYKSKKRGIDAWYADMWAVLWNLWYLNKNVKIHSEMDFSWPYSPIAEWESKAIQHYSGKIEDKKKYFNKIEYFNFLPWYDERLNSIPDSNCSFKIVEFIKSRRRELDDMRKKYSDIGILLISTEQDVKNYSISKSYINKYLDIDLCYLPCNYEIDSPSIEFFQENKYILCIPFNIVFSIDILQNILDSIAKSNLPQKYYSNNLYTVDALFNKTFSMVLDITLLEMNTGKMNNTNRDLVLFALQLSGDYKKDLRAMFNVMKNNRFHNNEKLELNTPFFILPNNLL